MTCPLCSRPVVWAHLCGQPRDFELSKGEGKIQILNGIAHDLDAFGGRYDGPRYDYHECKEKE